MGPIQTFDEFFGLLIRRRLVIAAVLLLGMIGSVMLGLSRPKTYEAAAVIQVELPVVQAGGDSPGQRAAQTLQVIEQRLTTRENLLALIDRHGLFADAPAMPELQKLAIMRSAIQFQPVASVEQVGYGQASSVSALIVLVTLGNAEQAARVANDLAQTVLDQSTAQQAGQARDNLAFFLQEEARLGAAITALEDEIARYKNANVADLANTASDRSAVDLDLRRVQQDLVAIQTERSALQAKPRQRETDRRRIEDLLVQEGVLGKQIAALEARLAALGATAARAPEIERQLGVYARQMEQLQGQMSQVTLRRTQAETDLRLEQEQHAEHFSLLERAVVPTDASGGGGKKIAMAGSVVSLLLGIGLAFLLDLMHPVIRSAAQMQRDLDLRPVITLPEIKMPRQPGPLALLWRRLRGEAA